MGSFMVYLAFILGVLFDMFKDKVATHIKALFSKEKLESLENMVDTIPQNFLQRVKEQSLECYKQLDELRTRVEGLAEEHPEWWNICSRYRRSKDIDNLISEIENPLKLVPLIQLDCVISRLLELVPLIQLDCVISRLLELPPPRPPAPAAPSSTEHMGRHAFPDPFSGLITCVLKIMCFYIGRVVNFPKKLKSFKKLLEKMKPFIQHIGNGINEIQRGNDASNWLNNASNWVDEMNDLVVEGIGIKETRSPIARCERSKQITELTSKIDVHLNQLSWINLELLFHEIERTRSHPRPPQIERPRSHPRPPQETEGSTSHPSPSQETEGCTSQPPQALQDHGVCPHYNYVPGGVCPHYVLGGFCPHYNYVPRGFCPHYHSVGHDPCPTM